MNNAFSLSTRWNAGRHSSGEDMIEQILRMGFDAVELGYDLRIDLVPGVKKMVEQKAIRVTSVHNFCPVPVGVLYGSPELFSLSGLERRDRESAVINTKKTIEFAAEVGAKIVVVHAGNVDMTRYTSDLIELAETGQQYTPKYEKLKLKLIETREKKVNKHLSELYKSFDELLPSLQQTGVRIGIENLPSWESIPSETEMEEILAHYNTPFISYWHDMGHGQTRHNLGFISHKRWLDRLSPRLAGMHVHDITPPARDHQMPPAGKIPFSDFKSIARSGIVLVLEPAPGTPEENIRHGAQIIGEAWEMPFPNKG